MTTNKKNTLIFVLFVLLPLILAIVNYYLADFNTYKWGYDHINQVSFVALAIGVLTCGYIMLNNYRSSKSKTWYILSGLFGISYLIYLYLIYSLSNFGF